MDRRPGKPAGLRRGPAGDHPPPMGSAAAICTRFLGLDGGPALAAWASGPVDRARTLAAVGAVLLAAALPLKLTPMHLCAGLMLVGVLAARAPLWRMPGFWPLVLILPWAAASALMSGHPDPIGGWGYLYVPLALPVACCALAATPWVPRAALVAMAGGVAVHALVAGAQFIIGYDSAAPLGIDPGGERFSAAPGLRAGNVGPSMYLGAAAFLLWGLPAGGGAAAAVLWAGRIAALAGLAMLKARTVLVGAATACTALVAHRDTRRRGRILAGVAVIVALGAGVLALHDPGRLGRMVAGDDPRLLYWRLAGTDVAAHPLVGMGGQRAYADGIRERWQSANGERWFERVVTYNAHNTPLNLAAFHGLPALALHLAALGALILAAWRHGRLATALAVFWVVCGCFDATFTEQRTAYVLAMTMALALAWPRPGSSGKPV